MRAFSLVPNWHEQLLWDSFELREHLMGPTSHPQTNVLEFLGQQARLHRALPLQYPLAGTVKQVGAMNQLGTMFGAIQRKG